VSGDPRFGGSWREDDGEMAVTTVVATTTTTVM
jgi:hypothetical protein